MKTTLSSSLRAYIQIALWSSELDRGYSESDLTPEAIAKMQSDCERFETENAETLTNAIATGEVRCGPDFNEWERAAHDFWLTRNHHGAGFWDGDWPEPFAKQLTDSAHGLSSQDLYVGDDGRLYVS